MINITNENKLFELIKSQLNIELSKDKLLSLFTIINSNNLSNSHNFRRFINEKIKLYLECNTDKLKEFYLNNIIHNLSLELKELLFFEIIKSFKFNKLTISEFNTEYETNLNKYADMFKFFCRFRLLNDSALKPPFIRNNEYEFSSLDNKVVIFRPIYVCLEYNLEFIEHKLILNYHLNNEIKNDYFAYEITDLK